MTPSTLYVLKASSKPSVSLMTHIQTGIPLADKWANKLACKPRKVGGFIPDVNIVAYLPGFMIMGRSVGLRGLIS